MDPRSRTGHDAFLERLFAAPFGKFTEVRKELARELRQTGDRAAADALAATKRPTRSAWALNQVARNHPRELAAFVAVAERVRDAQKRAVSARDAGGMRDAGREMSASASSIAKLAAHAIERDGSSASPAIERAILGTLRAVPFLSHGDREQLTRGLLVADLEPPDDLAILGTVSGGAMHHDEGAPRPRNTAGDARREREEARRERAEEARRAHQVEKLEHAAVEAEREAAKRERTADAAATRARALANEASEARAEARRARAAADAARRNNP